VVDGVFQASLTRLEDAPLGQGLIGRQVAHLIGQRVSRMDEQIVTALGLADPYAEGLVGFLEDHHVRRRVVTQLMAPDLVRAQGLGILAYVEEGPAVLGPYAPGRDVCYQVGKVRAGGQVAKP